MKNYKYVVLFLVAFGNFLACFTQYQTGSLSTQLINGFNLNSGQFARLTTAQMIPTIFLSIFIGSISDKLGSRKTILIGLIITVLSLFLKLNSTSYVMLFIACMGGGLTGSFLNTINSKIINSWFEPEELGIMMGIVQASLSLGQVIALAMSGGCTYNFIFKISFIMGLILLILWIVFAKDSDREI
ncbi:MAG: MFS transporter, partial [Bacillota bacterium]|nr:MFS transporter [Bacillota bacterium]